ncbi:hypothetical protein [Maridesulfovibrio hydrothermalis]|uniref:Uncharacterized protein n=1 Tax=Maridesulfovibrio hydrothermalis AM13 = DSM 14728 TaxID=1121451 RepID=L0RE00_9BACT|nr:hypothetical protein [Maridesulfovibrio hydrothermalis]CCO25018.1 conserved protein of unknown function [Maridesulfovibrio hydrothermalis AM13 = DSM 14728]
MFEISTETLTALYPFESKRTLRNYALFIEENLDWHEFGYSFLDYKGTKVIPEYSSSIPPKSICGHSGDK